MSLIKTTTPDNGTGDSLQKGIYDSKNRSDGTPGEYRKSGYSAKSAWPGKAHKRLFENHLESGTLGLLRNAPGASLEDRGNGTQRIEQKIGYHTKMPSVR